MSDQFKLKSIPISKQLYYKHRFKEENGRWQHPQRRPSPGLNQTQKQKYHHDI